MSLARFTLDHAAFAGRAGRGITVAVIDSGINPHNPHIGLVAGGVHIALDGEDEEWIDRLGHGTAVAAAIREKAPAVELLAVRVFERALSTGADVLARAIEWAAGRGCHIINLSLGTPYAAREELLHEVVQRAVSAGALVVSARELNGVRWLPGSLPGVAGVELEPDCPREEMRVAADTSDQPVFHASGYPRPIPGVPAERNVQGISFAVANVSGFLARLLEGRPDLRTIRDVDVLLRGQIGDRAARA